MPPRQSSRRTEILPTLPIVFGLGEVEAAAAIGVSANTFRAMVQDGRMPKPRRIGERRVYDVDELRAAFKSLPADGERAREKTGWEDVV